MKRYVAAVLMSVFLIPQMFAADEAGYLGLGLVTGLSREGNVNLVDNTKINVFLGSGSKFLGPLPIYLGWEALVGFQNIGESSTVSTYYEGYLVETGKWKYLGVTQVTEELKLSFWDIDISPRAMVTADLGLVAASAYGGFNYNFINMHWKYSISSTTKTEEGDEVLSVSPLQIVTGFRLSALFFYLEYTRFFDITKGDITWQKIAENRISIGGILKF